MFLFTANYKAFKQEVVFNSLRSRITVIHVDALLKYMDHGVCCGIRYDISMQIMSLIKSWELLNIFSM